MSAQRSRLDADRHELIARAMRLLAASAGTRGVIVVLTPTADGGLDSNVAAYCDETDLVTAGLCLLTAARERLDPAYGSCGAMMVAIDAAIAAFPEMMIGRRKASH